MASAKAMARIACTMILFDAPGLRPTAAEAWPPIRPTAIAAPRAASPTCMLPVIGIVLSGSRRHRHAVRTRQPSAVGCPGPRFLVLADEQREDCRQQHEHQRLYQPDH